MTTFSTTNRSATTYTPSAKNIIVEFVLSFFLLKEDGFYLLQENGSKIILDGVAAILGTVKNTTTYTPLTKN